ncbi:MAG: VWA domain-containing protein [Desulfobacteraceae bacterium]|nr:MAG: VWA domain-containing protein [Desulfobacteraceae bacterium]
MKFSDPEYLFVLWMVLFAAGILFYGHRKREQVLKRFASSQMRAVLVPHWDSRKRWVKSILVILALTCTILALSGPLAGFKWVKTRQKGVDIMVALDCSRSMLAQDIKPSRLERAKREIVDLLNMLESDRAGLVAFSGQAILQCPLTLDHEAFHLFLKVLSPQYLPVGGTDLTAAISTCLDAFEKDSDTDKAIILITDGEDTVSEVEAAAKRAAEKGVKLYGIGVGNVEGAPIPDSSGGFKKDDEGNIVMSKVDEKTLQKISAIAGGAYVRSVAGDMDLDAIYYTHIKKNMDEKTLTTSKRKVWENRFQWILFPAVLMLLVELLLFEGNGKPGRRILSMMLLFLVIQFSPVPAQAFVFNAVKKGIEAYQAQQFEQAKNDFIKAQLDDPDNPKIYYDIGTAAYKNQEYDLALKSFEKAAQSNDPELAHKALYNQANTRYRMGNLDEAIKDYEKVLESFPGDQLAKENLEFVKQQKEKQEQQQQEQQQQQSSSDQDQKNQDQSRMNRQDQGESKKDSKNSEQDQQTGKENHSSSENREQNHTSQKNKDQQSKDQDASPGAAPKEQEKQGSGENQDNTTEPQPQKDRNDQSIETGRKQDGENAQAARMNENMLNRLQDKPGQALMPRTRPQHIKNDW